ncbi:MAG: hypothetical protein U0132_02120 [Gemmatimonadaceae bacterium]
MTTLQAERIDYASCHWPLACSSTYCIAIGWETQTCRPDKDEYPQPDPAIARTQPVSDQELATILSADDYEGSYLDNFGSAEVRYLGEDLQVPALQPGQAADFMRMVSDHCRVLDHHPGGGTCSIT